MLTSLAIRDFAIIDELELAFEPGLNVMTGETGAGKTIIVEALKLVLGGRASSELIRSGSERASVTAVFDAANLPKAAREALEDAGVPCDEELIVHRSIGAGGKGRIAISGVPVTAAVLKTAMMHLVDVSSQHEHQLLLEEPRHPGVLDAFGGLGTVADAYREAHQRLAAAAADLAAMEASERSAAERLEFLQFQLKELNDAAPEPGEEERIEAERGRLKHAVLLKEKSGNAEELLAGEETSAAAAIDRALQCLAACAPFEPQAAAWQEGLARARIEVQDVARELGRYTEAMSADPGRLEELEERMHRLRALARKHGGTLADAIRRREEISAEVERFQHFDEHLEERRAECTRLNDARRAAAKSLSTARRKAAASMGERVSAELGSLGMKKAQFAVRLEEREETAWDESGPDEVAFLFSPNPGEPARPLARIASGGELSRVMLGIKSALAKGEGIALTAIFDEVDSGIGGAIAAVVGRKLADLAADRQVIAITHLPQVAVHGRHHLRIAKHVKAGRTITTLEPLAAKGRVEEIARMLAGEGITEAAVRHAKELLAEAQS